MADHSKIDKTPTATILAIGDIHLGTRPASVPIDDSDINPDKLTPEAALDQATSYAIDNQVDAVLFAGDVVESKNARYEALRPLERCIARLQENSISVIGVAGNHDTEALPRLAKLLPEFRLLGEGGKWETIKLSRQGKEYAEIVGWSFGQRKVTESPVGELLEGNDLKLDEKTVPRIGLLHCDLGVVTSNYAPVSIAELKNTGFDAWLLGHIHKPSLSESQDDQKNGSFGYLGSLVGLNPKETGDHGPWLISFDGNSRPTFKQILTAPLRWEDIEVSVEGVNDADDVGDIILSAMETLAASFPEDGDLRPNAIGVRVHLTGASTAYEDISTRIEEEEWLELRRRSNRIIVFINKIYNDMELSHDLEKTARGDDPPALLARKILTLQQGGKEAIDLINAARETMKEVANKTHWNPLNKHRDAVDPLDDQAVNKLLITAARAALSRLLAQKTNHQAVT